MTNRNLIIRKLEITQGKMKILKNIVNTKQPLEEYIKNIQLTEELLEELTSLIEREPRTAGEMNYLG